MKPISAQYFDPISPEMLQTWMLFLTSVTHILTFYYYHYHHHHHHYIVESQAYKVNIIHLMSDPEGNS